MKSAALALLLFALPALATQPNPSQRQRELIDELLAATKPEELVRKALDQMLAQMMQSAEKQAGEPGSDAEREQRAEGKKDFERFRELIGQIDYKQLTRDIYIPLYAQYFDEQQLAEVVAFMKSPAGQRFIRAQSDLQSDAMRASQDVMEEKVKSILQQVNDERSKRRPWEKTMRDMRSLNAAIEAWASDHEEKYPGAQSLEQLRKELQPNYVKEMPEKDSWGTSYAYVVSTDRDHFRIVSAGADGVFDWDSRRIAVPKEKEEPQASIGLPEPKLSERLEDDLIMADGVFIQIPRAARHDQ